MMAPCDVGNWVMRKKIVPYRQGTGYQVKINPCPQSGVSFCHPTAGQAEVASLDQPMVAGSRRSTGVAQASLSTLGSFGF